MASRRRKFPLNAFDDPLVAGNRDRHTDMREVPLASGGRPRPVARDRLVPTVVLNEDFDLVCILRLPLPFAAVIAAGYKADDQLKLTFVFLRVRPVL